MFNLNLNVVCFVNFKIYLLFLDNQNEVNYIILHIIIYTNKVNVVIVLFCLRCLQSVENADPQFHLEYRGPVTMKGKKEPMKVWFLSRKT